MINKYFSDEDIDFDDLYFTCYMIERVARNLHQRNRYVVNAIGRDELYHLISCAKAFHCENPLDVEQHWISDYKLKEGDFDITDVDGELAEIVPSPTQIGKLYAKIYDYNCSAFYEPSYVIARAYQAGGF